MKVYITRDWGDKTYEIWTTEPENWNSQYLDYEGVSGSGILLTNISPKEAKEMFKLDKHLKKKEIKEGTMTFKIKK